MSVLGTLGAAETSDWRMQGQERRQPARPGAGRGNMGAGWGFSTPAGFGRVLSPVRLALLLLQLS